MTNEEAKVFLDNLKICINEHPIVADWLVEIADRKTENCSEIPNNCEDEPQTYITEDRDTQILDAWQVNHRNTTSVEDEPQTDEFELFDREDLVALIEAQRERIAELLQSEVTTDCRHTERSE